MKKGLLYMLKIAKRALVFSHNEERNWQGVPIRIGSFSSVDSTCDTFMLQTGGKVMTDNKIDIKALDAIFNSLIQTMDQSKNDIFIISEQSRKSFAEMEKELIEVKIEIGELITESDTLEVLSGHSRKRLADVSRRFTEYTEAQVKESYEVANKLHLALSINQVKEKQLRQRRDELERRLRELLETIERADHLVSRVSTISNYLTSDLKDVGVALEDAKNKKDFAVRIIQAQEEERKRLSRDIHDGPAQMLANVLIRSGLIEKTYTEKGAELAMLELSALKETVKDALLEVRRIIFDLRPMALDDLGLIPTLRKYLSQMTSFGEKVEIHFQSSGQEQRFHTDIEVAVFRLVQESVSNSMKHGQAKDIWVKIEWVNDILNIVVKDDGIGFDKNEVRDKSFGLIGMRERIVLLKGTMKITSEKAEGTSILFQIPLESDIS